MAYKYGGLPSLASLDDDNWKESRDAIRLALHRIDRALHQVYSGANTLGSGVITPQNLGGLGGGSTVTVNQVNEDDLVGTNTDGILVFGRGETDSLAHAIRVSQEGEILIAELPGTVTLPNNSQLVNFPEFITHIGVIQYATLENASVNEIGNNVMSKLSAGVWLPTEDNWGIDVTEDYSQADVGLLTMPSPKVYTAVDSESGAATFNGRYYVVGTPPNGWPTLPRYLGADSVGTGHANTTGGLLWNVARFRRGTFFFVAGINGSYTGIMTITLWGSPTTEASAAIFPLKQWSFNADTITNNHVLRFDVETPFIRLSIDASGSPDGSNNYQIQKFAWAFQS